MVITEKSYLDGYLKKNLDIAINNNKKDWDAVILIDGVEGGGKSVLGMQVASYLDPSYSLDRCCFSATQLIRAINTAQPHQAIVFDEALRGLSSRSALSKINRIIVKLLAEIRQKNLFVIIILPSYFDLDKNIAIWRSVCLLHVYTSKGNKRGFFAFYDYDQKKTLFILGKKMYDYKQVKSSFVGRFTNQYTVPEDEYRKKKREMLSGQIEDHELATTFQVQLRSLQKSLWEDKELKLSYKDIARMINKHSGLMLTPESVRMALKRFNPEEGYM